MPEAENQATKFGESSDYEKTKCAVIDERFNSHFPKVFVNAEIVCTVSDEMKAPYRRTGRFRTMWSFLAEEHQQERTSCHWRVVQNTPSIG